MIQICDEPSVLDTVSGHVQSAVSVLEVSQSHLLPHQTHFSPMMKIAPNKNNTKQDFFSTKK